MEQKLDDCFCIARALSLIRKGSLSGLGEREKSLHRLCLLCIYRQRDSPRI